MKPDKGKLTEMLEHSIGKARESIELATSDHSLVVMEENLDEAIDTIGEARDDISNIELQLEVSLAITQYQLDPKNYKV